MHRNQKIGALLFVMLPLVFALSGFGQNPEKSRVDKWREDLRFIATELPRRHKDYFRDVNRADFEKAVNNLDGRIPNLTDNQVALEMAKIVSMVPDGHTGLWAAFDPAAKFRFLPLRFYLFKEGLYVQTAVPEYAGLVGARVISIGSAETQAAISKVGDYVPHDNKYGIKNTAPVYLGCPEVLQALGFVPSADEVDLTVEKSGKRSTVKVKTGGNFDSINGHEARKGWVDASDGAMRPVPLWRKDIANPYWFEYVPKDKLLYVKLGQVQNKQDETVEAFFVRVGKAVDANDVDKLVLDIRNNGGGNNGLVPTIIRSIVKADKIDQKGKFFVIIGRQTFSAAQNLTNALETYTKAVFVGEPTASHVNMFGDARPVFLPNSKLRVNISSLWWQNMVELDRRTWTSPHVAAEPTFADYANNIDPAIEAVRNYRPQPTITELVRADFEAGNMAAVKAKLIEFRKDPVNEFVSVEAEVNAFGYRLLANPRTAAQAIELFKLNTQLYPDSANVFDSLGEALAGAGRRDEAIKAYKQALQIDPKYASSIEGLHKLKEN